MRRKIMAEYTKRQQAYMAAVQQNTPTGFQLVLGWPDQKYGVTKYNYEQYLKDVAEDFEPSPALDFEAWKKRELQNVGDDLGWTTHGCELCGNPYHGTGHAATAINPPDEGDYSFEVCTPCLMYIANGDIEDDEQLDWFGIEEESC
jgi:hypothetical protein